MIDLNGNWLMKATNDAEWKTGIVPGSVYTDLLRNGEMQDPFYREEEDAVKALSALDYVYKREFTVTKLDQGDYILVMEGIDTIGEVRINGALVGKTDNMHRTWRIAIREYLITGINEIHILLKSPLEFINQKQKKRPLWGVTDTVAGYPHIRKAHSMFGWDWGPQLPDLGIFRNIYIEEAVTGRIDGYYVTQYHREQHVELEIQVNLELYSPEDILYCEILDPQGSSIYQEWKKAEALVNYHTTILEPALWWPNGLGEQNLYTIQIRQMKDGVMLHERNSALGLRTLNLVREKDAYGESFGFEINGYTMFAKGANYIPEDNLLGRCSKERTRKLLESCVDAGFNFIRVWGGGYYPSDWFYELCDEMGLVVWQDMMFACAVYDLTESFAASITAEMTDNIKRIRNHPCLGLWCGNNEMESAWVGWNLPPDEKLRADYLTMFERLIPELVQRYSPETSYWPSSPSSGGGFCNTSDDHSGDAHYWDIWHGRKLFSDIENRFFRFASEYGFQSIPSIQTVRSFALEEDMDLFSPVMEKHQKCMGNGNGNITLMNYLFEYYRTPKDFEHLIYTTQILQGDCLETAISHFRSHREQCQGSTYWQLNDCNPVISWATIDYFGRWKASHYMVKRAHNPVILHGERKKDCYEIYCSNETREQISGSVRVRLWDQELGDLATAVYPAELDLLSSRKLGEFQLPKQYRERECCVILEYTGAETVPVRVFPLSLPKYFSYKQPEIQAVWSEEAKEVRLSLTSDVYTGKTGIAFGERDVILSDNYFDLLPGQTRTITLKDVKLTEQLKSELQITSIYDIILHNN